MRLARRKDPAGPVHAVRRTGQPDPRFNYELFNCNNFNIRYWSWNYRGCWPLYLTGPFTGPVGLSGSVSIHQSRRTLCGFALWELLPIGTLSCETARTLSPLRRGRGPTPLRALHRLHKVAQLEVSIARTNPGLSLPRSRLSCRYTPKAIRIVDL